MSSRRARSGGSLTLTTLSRWYRSWRNVPDVDRLGQVAVGRRDQADVHLDRLVGPDPDDLARLERPEQLDLGRERDVADLVEEQGAAVGVLEPPFALAVGAGEGAPDVAEELAFEDVLAQSGTVQGDERLVAARAVVVDRLGDEFLAGAALAGDQDGGRGRGDLAEPGDDGVHRAASCRSLPRIRTAR